MKHIKLFEDYSNKYKTIVILGLPGSGKSHLANKILKENPGRNYVIYDDNEWMGRNTPGGIGGIDKIGTENQIVSDGTLVEYFTEHSIRKMGEDKGADVEFIYFENDPEKALHNAKKRWESGEAKSYQDEKHMVHSIGSLSRSYVIPKDVTPLPIWLRP